MFFNSMAYQLGGHGFSCPCRYITDRRVFNGMFNDEPGNRNDVFLTNLNFVFIILMFVSVFGMIVEFKIVILALHLD